MSPAESTQDFSSLAMKEAWERSCAGKEKFPSMSAAQTFAQLMHQRRIGHHRDFSRDEWLSLRAYKCVFADKEKPHWHLGHATT